MFSSCSQFCLSQGKSPSWWQSRCSQNKAVSVLWDPWGKQQSIQHIWSRKTTPASSLLGGKNPKNCRVPQRWWSRLSTRAPPSCRRVKWVSGRGCNKQAGGRGRCSLKDRDYSVVPSCSLQGVLMVGWSDGGHRLWQHTVQQPDRIWVAV